MSADRSVSSWMIARVEQACRVLDAEGVTEWSSGDLCFTKGDRFGLAISQTISALGVLTDSGVLVQSGAGPATRYAPGPAWVPRETP